MLPSIAAMSTRANTHAEVSARVVPDDLAGCAQPAMLALPNAQCLNGILLHQERVPQAHSTSDNVSSTSAGSHAWPLPPLLHVESQAEHLHAIITASSADCFSCQSLAFLLPAGAHGLRHLCVALCGAAPPAAGHPRLLFEPFHLC